jgi:hypothetical protein
MDEVQKSSDSDKSHRSRKCSYFPLRTAFNKLIGEFLQRGLHGALLVLVSFNKKQKQNIL